MHPSRLQTQFLNVPVEQSVTHSHPESNLKQSSFHVRSLQFARHIDLDIALLYRTLKLT